MWNPAERTTHREIIEENEFVWVVSGAQQAPRRWYSVATQQDFGRLAEDAPEDIPSPVLKRA